MNLLTNTYYKLPKAGIGIAMQPNSTLTAKESSGEKDHGARCQAVLLQSAGAFPSLDSKALVPFEINKNIENVGPRTSTTSLWSIF